MPFGPKTWHYHNGKKVQAVAMYVHRRWRRNHAKASYQGGGHLCPACGFMPNARMVEWTQAMSREIYPPDETKEPDAKD